MDPNLRHKLSGSVSTDFSCCKLKISQTGKGKDIPVTGRGGP
jgi:hypothetical protein